MASPFRSYAAPRTWSGATEKDVAVAQAALGMLCNLIWSDPLLPTQVVAGGRALFRQTVLRQLQGFRLVTGEDADIIFADLVRLHALRFPGATPAQVLNAWAPVSPPTQAEIDAAWELESDSTEDARKFFYGPRWDAPHRVMQELNDPKANDPIIVRPTHG